MFPSQPLGITGTDVRSGSWSATSLTRGFTGPLLHYLWPGVTNGMTECATEQQEKKTKNTAASAKALGTEQSLDRCWFICWGLNYRDKHLQVLRQEWGGTCEPLCIHPMDVCFVSFFILRPFLYSSCRWAGWALGSPLSHRYVLMVDRWSLWRQIRAEQMTQPFWLKHWHCRAFLSSCFRTHTRCPVSRLN